MSLFSKAAMIGGVVAFAKSAKGRELTAKAKTYLQDPETQRKIADVTAQVKNKISGKGDAGTQGSAPSRY